MLMRILLPLLILLSLCLPPSRAETPGLKQEPRHYTSPAIASLGTHQIEVKNLAASTYQSIAVVLTSAAAVNVELDVEIGFEFGGTIYYFPAPAAQNIVAAGASPLFYAQALIIPVASIIRITATNNGAAAVTFTHLFLATS
jgi:hypothetical protein